MKPSFALNLSPDGIGLLHRKNGGWELLGEVPLDAPDFGERLGKLRRKAQALAPEGMVTKLIIPASQVLYTEVVAPGPRPAMRRKQIATALEGLTPYVVDDLVFDWSGRDEMVQVAVVARETLTEAEAFAEDWGFNPVSFVTVPQPGSFAGEPWFGPADGAAVHLPEGGRVERDQDPVPLRTAARAAEETPEPEAEETPVVAPAPASLDDAEIPLEAVAQAAPAQGAAEAPAPEIAVAEEPAPPAPVEPEVFPDAAPEMAQADPGAETLLEMPPAEAELAPEFAFEASPETPEPEPEPAPEAAPLAPEFTLAPEAIAPAAPEKLAEELAEDLRDDESAFTAELQAALNDTPAEAEVAEPLPEAVETVETAPAPTAEPAPADSADLQTAGLQTAGLETAALLPDEAETSAGLVTEAEMIDLSALEALDFALNAPEAEVVASADLASQTEATAPAFASRRAAPLSTEPPAGGHRALGGVARLHPVSAPERKSLFAKVTDPGLALPESEPEAEPDSGPPTTEKLRKAAGAGLRRAAQGTAALGGSAGKALAQGLRPAPASARPAAPEEAAKDDTSVPEAPFIEAKAARTVFGGRKSRHVGGKPRYLGLMLIGGLVAFMAIVALWSSYLGEAPTDAPATEQLAEAPATPTPTPTLTTPEAVATAQTGPTGTGTTAPAAAEAPLAALQDGPAMSLAEAQSRARAEAAAPAETTPAPDATMATASAPAEAPAPDATAPASDTAAAPEPEAAPTTAQTALPPLAPLAPLPPLGSLEAPMPEIAAPAADVATVEPPAAPAPELLPTPEGTLAPGGFTLYAGKPARVSKPRPATVEKAATAAAAAANAPYADPALARFRPKARPATVEKAAAAAASAPPAAATPETAAPALPETAPAAAPADDGAALNPGLSPAEERRLAQRRPKTRPAAVVKAAAAYTPPPEIEVAPAAPEATANAFADATAQAVSVSRRPAAKPRSFKDSVERALAAAIAAEPAPAPAAAPAPAPAPVAAAPAPKAETRTAAAAPAPAVELDEPEPTTAMPRLPTSASVAKQATEKNALAMNETNLIGLYGAPGNRRALVRLPNGRFVKVGVGDRLDGGKVTAIGDSQMTYQKGGRAVTLKLLKGG